MLPLATSSNHPLHQLRSRGARPDGPRSILLTGATGDHGARLLDGLLRTTDAVIVCLVRDQPGAEPLARIASALRRACGRVRNLDRVAPVLGNLEDPRLGLDPAAYASLTTDLDGIIHADR